MSSSRTPNKSRFIEAATIYKDAMAAFIDGVLGSDLISSWLFSDEARSRNEKKYEKGMQALKQGKSIPDIIDFADIPFLIRENLHRFSSLNREDVNRMFAIHNLWTDMIKHYQGRGDFLPEDTAEYATHCARVLRRCGFDADADAIIGTSASEATEAPVASASDLRERREWERARLSEKSLDERTRWEQERLADFEWEAERERRAERKKTITSRGRARLSIGSAHGVGLREDGRVVCWGVDWSMSDDGHSDEPPEDDRFVAVSAGGSHSVALREDGTVVCWGRNDDGQCKAPEGQFIAVSAGLVHSVALREDGTVVCWGRNDDGQCKAPEGQFAAVSAGGIHSVALREDGTVVCWGFNSHGQCDEPPEDRFVAVSAGGSHSVGIREDGRVVCWGANGRGQCEAPPEDRFVAVSAGAYHNVGIREDGRVVRWGLPLGMADAGQFSEPTEDRFIAVSADLFRSVGLREDGTVICWQSDRSSTWDGLPKRL